MVLGCKIYGTVTQDGAGVEGVTIVLSGDADMTTVTNSAGYYEFNSVSLRKMTRLL
jgi:hypothetical protein